ncbi:hypothetical protein ACHAXA_009641 [Cyclostephanos tholiformis]|uniref:Apple domain-containing protein n=1 Tax=Cyclostephanos tholiformis TaxID=382380 RepID=A0ABD3SE00_9STRA
MDERYDCDADDEYENRVEGRRRYNKFPDGIVTLGLDDGGCYFCGGGKISRDGIGAGVRMRHPTSHNDLIEMCRDLCDSMSDCVSFTVGRDPSHVTQAYLYGSTISNCCLERRMYPPELYVVGGGRGVDDDYDYEGGRKMDYCEMEASCWTRYERDGARDGERTSTRADMRRRCKGVDDRDGGSTSSSSPFSSSSEGGGSKPTPPASSPSSRCFRTWEPVVYADDELKAKSRYIAGGCIRDDGSGKNDETYANMLRYARDRCMAETFAESMAVSVILRPSSGSATSRSAYVIVRAFS